MNMTKLKLSLLLFFSIAVGFAQESTLTVEKIMQDPSWMGTFPSDIHWSVDSQTIYFQYNPKGEPADSLYKISLSTTKKISPVHAQEAQNIVPNRGDYNADRSVKTFVRNGNLWLYFSKSKKQKKILDLGTHISNPIFLVNEKGIAFSMNKNAYIYHKGTVQKITNFHSGQNWRNKEEKLNPKNKWLKEENLKLLKVVRQRKEDKEASKSYNEMVADQSLEAYYYGKKSLRNITVSPDGKYVFFRLFEKAKNKNTIVPNYVDANGYTTDLPARSKVGGKQRQVQMGIYNVARDTVYFVQTNSLPGITDIPAYSKFYPDREWEEKTRKVVSNGPYFSDDGQYAVIDVRALDHKDRWIAKVDLQTGALTSLDRQQDDAWIAGPGIGWTYWGGVLGWLPDDEHIYFQSEASGFSHLYILNVDTGKKKQLTKGEYEVFDPFISKDGRSWFLTASKVDMRVRHFYKMPLMGGKMVQLTQMVGNNQVTLSPDEEHMAIRYSYANKPWELYLKPTSADAKATQLTRGQSDAFKAYAWRAPKFIKFKAEDGTKVPARLYLPEENAKNGAAVIFVHGAGYLQNAHKWWSLYFREYMFNNLLTDLGYTVLDIDYRGSAGYGRDWRTAIYRHMGGKDLSDQVDGAQFLIEEYNIDPDRVGIYGGSYGGFITLMAMFKENDVFTAGAALRSVTDWAHYNHGYTSNILNTPTQDPKAYRQSSPIYFAEGFDHGHLLIEHGMLDRNVHFEDVVRLTQRLIELKKENWEMAIYPTEGHGFVTPTSWMDEYKRILKLFNTYLLD